MRTRRRFTPAIVVSGIGTFLCGVLMGHCAAAAEPAASPKAAARKQLETFDYRGVSLDGGRLRLLTDQARDDYLRIPNDDLLKGFRHRAGLPAPGHDLGGWYSGDVFHV